MDTTGRKMVRAASRPEVAAKPPRRMRAIAEKRAIVEETLEPGASVAVVARAHEVNANLVFGWRKLYRLGLLEPEAETPAALLPVKLAHPPRVHSREASYAGVVEIELASGDRLHLHGRVDRRELAQVIEILRAR